MLGAWLLGPKLLPIKYYKGFMRLALVMFVLAAMTRIWVYSTCPNPPGSEPHEAAQ